MAKKTIFHNPWLIATGSAILGVIGIRIIDYIVGTTILPSIWNFIKSIFIEIGKFFLLKFEVSLWFLIALPIFIVAIIIFVLWIVSLLQDKKKSLLNQQAPFLSYREDNFGDVLYRWVYFKNYSDKYEISNISHYCPKCKCSIVYHSCPVCHASFYNKIKTNYEIDALIRHKIETQLNIK
jgi:hypothetical protein